MFITVKFGDSIDLLDESGALLNLSEMERSSESARNYVQERQQYILLKIIRGDGSEPIRYQSLLEKLEQSHPLLAERLEKLSNPQLKEKARTSMQKKLRPLKESPSTTPTKSHTQSHKKGSVPFHRTT
ncbi:uncharacterized protein C22orf15 homolog isoform X2 [Microcaecilia unicolor]|uniref:Uncharacterized protein C22orf15 homolog isoform X2 n=1 Tax=Microcaecilia unicolor TaxID=1415580 RepID=A0A6P7ZB99_9AMPH|nr:uncharacterized protein C22orf15 homolog isoform X2 [Microcaecilia unicolor]